MLSVKAFNIEVYGLVQGIGFRPFIFKLAEDLNLKGFVNNNSKGVHICIEGEEKTLILFLHKLKNNCPPLSNITSITFEEKILENFTDFTIANSEIYSHSLTLISPDIAFCKDCLYEIENNLNRRFNYPFTNCTNCGPRFSIIKAIPYDRKNTTMNCFSMCNNCNFEYYNPLDRRFHAEPNNCEKCGPKLWLQDNKNNLISSSEDPIEYTAKKINKGNIFVIKGLSGFHLVCNGEDAYAINKLRVRKKRPHKPFAVMIKNMDIVKKYCYVNKLEEEMLTGTKKPIVILKLRKNSSIPNNIAPYQNTLGVMLPYTPLQYLLFKYKINILIMTSANLNSLPLEYKNDNAIKNLSHITDYFLLHNRDIEIALDDSIVQVVKDKIFMLRRARGYVPTPFNFHSNSNIFAFGSNIKNTFSFTKDNYIFTSQYNGALENIETLNRYENNIKHYKKLFDFSEDIIAYDFHPKYTSSILIKDKLYDNSKKIQIQHHHAHIASCMAENNLKETIIGIAYDGIGYGLDNTIWGGEFLMCNYKAFKRLGHLSNVTLPGGEIAVKEPWRMAVSYIYEAYKKALISSSDKNLTNQKFLNIVKNFYGLPALKLFKIIENHNSFYYSTSSIGRFFDAAASIIGIKQVITYEGQASMELQAILNPNYSNYYCYKIYNSSKNSIPNYIIDTNSIILSLLKDKYNNVPKDIMSAKFHNSITAFTIDMCKILNYDTGINSFALSGGVFQNSYIFENITTKLENLNFKVYCHKNYPCNDGGISLGQIVIANEIAGKFH